MTDAFIQFFDKPPFELFMIAVGFLGQALFAMRFIVQWITSEMNKKSVIPVAFWYFSLGGGCVLFTYALWRGDPVFIVGQGTGVFIYARNLWLIHQERRDSLAAATMAKPGED